jgi:hypothetical protein
LYANAIVRNDFSNNLQSTGLITGEFADNCHIDFILLPFIQLHNSAFLDQVLIAIGQNHLRRTFGMDEYLIALIHDCEHLLSL